MPKNNNIFISNSDYSKITLLEFLSIGKWVLKLIFNVSKTFSILYFATETIRKLLSLFWAYLFSRIIDRLILLAGNTSIDINSEVLQILAILIFFTIIETITSYVFRISFTGLRLQARPYLRSVYVTKLYQLGVQTLEQPEINNKVQRGNSTLMDLPRFYFDIIHLITEFIRFISAGFIIFSLNPVIAIILLFTFIPYVFFDKKMRVKSYRFDFETTEGARSATSNVDYLSSALLLNEVSILRGFNYLISKFSSYFGWLVKEKKKINYKWITGNHLIQFLIDIVIFSFYGVLFIDTLRKKITIGDLTFSTRAIDSFRNSLSNIISSANDLMEFSLNLKDLHYLFNMEPLVVDGKTQMEKLSNGPSIQIINAKFKYPNTKKYIFTDFNLHIKPGEKLAIVGHNGAGKTTLAKLIARFYNLESGNLLINDENIYQYSSDSYYQNLGVLWQDYNTYGHLSVKENVHIGEPNKNFNNSKFIQALKAADAYEFCKKFPNGFNTILSERFKGGIRPSTGQWQKIAIARFFYREAPIIIFDEPTASIDAKSEYNIFKNIYKFFTGKTVIIISHRFSTVRNADRIIVMDYGKIIEEGSHKHLMNLSGVYAEAFNLQAEGYIDKLQE